MPSYMHGTIHTGGEGLLFISSGSWGGVKFSMDCTSGLWKDMTHLDHSSFKNWGIQ